MREGDAAAVVGLVRLLAEDAGGRVLPKLDEARLLQEAFGQAPLIEVTVAELNGAIAGACLALLTYSTWRGARGLYIVDICVTADARGRGLGERLLREAARRGRARGADFIKLEVDTANPGAARFYERLGFSRNEYDRLYALEEPDLEGFTAQENDSRTTS